MKDIPPKKPLIHIHILAPLYGLYNTEKKTKEGNKY